LETAVTFPGLLAIVPSARRFVRGILAGSPRVDDIELIAAELASNAIRFSLLCFRVAIAAIGGKRTCGLCCSTTSSSLPLVTEPRETGQPPTGQGQLRHGYHRTRRVRREILHTPSGQDGGAFTVTVRTEPGWARIEVSGAGSGEWNAPRDGTLEDEYGRGLAIVAALADKLGHDIRASGQTVWAEVNW